jgi:hypothetical protein
MISNEIRQIKAREHLRFDALPVYRQSYRHG